MSENEAESDNKPGGWSGLIARTRKAATNVRLAFGLVWEADRRAFIGMVGVVLIFALLPAGQAWVGKLIIDTIVNSMADKLATGDIFARVLPLLALEFIFFATSAALNQLKSLLDHQINARLGHYINLKIMHKAVGLDLQYYEDAGFYDKLQNARREVNWRPLSMVNASFLVIQNIITILTLMALLILIGPLVVLILLVAVIPSAIIQMRYSGLYFRLLTWHSPEFRQRAYLEHLLTVDTSIKEIKLFGLGLPLIKRYDNLFWKFYNQDMKLARKRTYLSVFWGIISAASYYGAYAWVVYRTVSAEITLGDLTLYLAVLRQGQGSFIGTFHSIGEIYEGSLFMSNLFSFLNLKPKVEVLNKGKPVPQPIRQGIEFKNVSFRYPDREDWALRQINLCIAPGEKLALVGPNGAGKTTLVKLLTRLYEPTEGQILLDGVDLREYNLQDLRERIGVIFQDFVRYMVTARENIGFGQIQALDDEGRIISAAERGGATDVIEELPKGYDTVLGKWFDNGHELSGGQWQKIALGRAFMRDGNLLVLDEPTSALDAEREYEIFQRFRDLTEGKMALLISHRFSTVRMADRIAVVENGEITELGNHADLLALDGTYARLFNLQAEGYR